MPRSPTARDAAEGLGDAPKSVALTMLGNMVFNLRQPQRSCEREEIVRVLAEIEVALRQDLAALRSAGTEGGEAQGAVEMREACLRLCSSARYGAPSTWPGAFPRGWKPPMSWAADRAPTPGEAALHDNGVTDAWIAVLTGTRDEQGNPRVPAPIPAPAGHGQRGGEDA